MYLRTPKRYTRRGQRRRLLSWRTVLLWLMTPVIIFIGIGIYQNRAMFIPSVSRFVEGLASSAQSSISTAIAPTLTPTEDPRSRLEQASRAWDLGALNQAIRIYQEILPAVPNDVQAHERVTLGLIAVGRYEEALAAAEMTVNANPYSSDAWATRAWTLDWNGRAGEAVSSALLALELDPDNVRARAYLGEAYFSLNLTQRAYDTVNEALEQDADSYEAYRARGLINRLGFFDQEAAMEDFRAAYEIAPNMSFIGIDIAQMESARQNYEGAIDIMKDIIERDPENSRALYWLGDFYLRGLGDPNQAADYLSRCIQINPESISCYYLLGRAQFRLEQITLAQESFEQAIELGSSDPYHYWWAGNSYIAQGNCTGAMNYLRPGFEIARSGTNTDLIADYQSLMADCQFPGSSIATATPDPNASEAGSGA